MKFKMIHENFNVTDLDRSLAFYEKALGLHEVRRNIAPDGAHIICFVASEEADFELELTWLRDHPQKYDLGEEEFHLAFRTDDFDAAHALHESMGCICNEELLYELFGVNAELLIDHAWGWEPCTMKEIKAYRSESNSLGSGQVLQRPYDFAGGRLIVREMTDLLSLDLVDKELVTNQVVLTVGYDIESLTGQDYHGEITTDHYGRKIPKHAHGTENLTRYTSSTREIVDAAMRLYDRAAQFAPFKALTGYEDDVEETARLTDDRIELDAARIEQLDARLQFLEDHLAEAPTVSITFISDADLISGLKTAGVRRVHQHFLPVAAVTDQQIAVTDLQHTRFHGHGFHHSSFHTDIPPFERAAFHSIPQRGKGNHTLKNRISCKENKTGGCALCRAPIDLRDMFLRFKEGRMPGQS